MTTLTTIHAITWRDWPGSLTEPWQRTYECACGADLGFDEQGLGACDPETAFEEHLEEENR